MCVVTVFSLIFRRLIRPWLVTFDGFNTTIVVLKVFLPDSNPTKVKTSQTLNYCGCISQKPNYCCGCRFLGRYPWILKRLRCTAANIIQLYFQAVCLWKMGESTAYMIVLYYQVVCSLKVGEAVKVEVFHSEQTQSYSITEVFVPGKWVQLSRLRFTAVNPFPTRTNILV